MAKRPQTDGPQEARYAQARQAQEEDAPVRRQNRSSPMPRSTGRTARGDPPAAGLPLRRRRGRGRTRRSRRAAWSARPYCSIPNASRPVCATRRCSRNPKNARLRGRHLRMAVAVSYVVVDSEDIDDQRLGVSNLAALRRAVQEARSRSRIRDQRPLPAGRGWLAARRPAEGRRACRPRSRRRRSWRRCHATRTCAELDLEHPGLQLLVEQGLRLGRALGGHPRARPVARAPAFVPWRGVLPGRASLTSRDGR